MTIRKKKVNRGKTVIDLTGPDGNAFVLLGIARRAAASLGLDAKAITDEMKSGDYNHLIGVFDKYFGDYYILEY